jgi:hypothetical protein
VRFEIGELSGSLGSIDDEIYVPRERSVPGSAKALPLSKGFNPVSLGRLKRPFFRLREYGYRGAIILAQLREEVAAEKNAAPT